MIKHISFDLWGTLIKSNPDYKPQRNYLIRKFFGSLISDEQIKSGKGLLDKIMEVSGTQLSYAHQMLIIISGSYGRDIFYSHEFHKQQLIRFELENMQLVRECPPLLMDGAQEVLEGLLERDISTSVLSNTSFIPGVALHTALRQMKVSDYFLFEMFSDIELLAKPSPALYKRMVSRTYQQRHDVLHVGDNEHADSGAGIVSSIILNKEITLQNLLTVIDEKQNLLLSPVR
jgi:putative hydrolase of the HAD superfamily